MVHTGSMTPNIASGDLVIDRPAGPVHVGQVITFAKAPGQYVTHRVAAITPKESRPEGTPTPPTTSGTSASPKSSAGSLPPSPTPGSWWCSAPIRQA